MYNYVNMLAEDLQGIIESVVNDKVKNNVNEKISKIKIEDIVSLLPSLLINRLESPLLKLRINEFDNLLWSNTLNVQYKYTLTTNELLLEELIDEINNLIDYENDHPNYYKNTITIFAGVEPYVRMLSNEFYTKLKKLLRNFDIQKEVNCNPVYLASYCLVKQ